MEYVALFCRLTVAATFVVALVAKARSGRAFADALGALALVSERRVPAVARAMVAAEAAVVVLLVAPPTVTVGFAAGAVVLGAFVAAIAVALRRGASAPCGCFGSGDNPLGAPHIVRNVALIGACVLGALGAADAASLHAGGIVVAALGAAIATLVLAVLDDIVEALSWTS